MKYTETNQSSDEDGDGEQQNILSIWNLKDFFQKLEPIKKRIFMIFSIYFLHHIYSNWFIFLF
jgi:hypothetical protein